MTGMKWQDTSMSSPLYALMRELADDEAPHLNSLPEEAPEVQALRARAMEGIKAGRRATGAAKAAVTKAARAASTEGGQYPRLTDGSAKQTEWATKIRSEKTYASHAYRDGGWERTIDPGMAAIIRRRTTAKFWIDTRSMSWERMVEKYAPKA